MSAKSITKKIGALAGLATLAAFSQNASPAMAADDACAASHMGAVTVGNGVCELTYLSSPIGAFQVPAGVTALQALLVAGGGGSSLGYAGGGGEVKVVDLQTTGDVTITVAAASAAGADGEDSSVAQGATTFTANGGGAPQNYASGSSGNGNGPVSYNGGAGGAGGAGGRDVGDNHVGDVGVNPVNQPELNGGLGLLVKDIPGATLFSDDTNCYGGGGATDGLGGVGNDIQFGWNGVAVCGGGSTVIDPATDTVTPVAAVDNSGGGAGAHVYDSTGNPGASGRVVLRYTLEEVVPVAYNDGGTKTLANTGGLNETVPFIFGVALVAAGAFALRRRSN